MAASRRFPRLFLALAVFVCVTPFLLGAQSQEDRWKKVDKAISEGLPKTAISELQPIIESALAGKKYDEAIKAIGLRVSLEANIQGNQPAERIVRLEAEVEKAAEPMKPVMRAILANAYWQYFQQNQWRFQQRTQTSGPPGDDFTTWSLPQILAHVDAQFQAVLADAEVLQEIPVRDFEAVLDKGNAPDSYRPTMYDVLAHNALDFYTSGVQAGSQVQDSFVLTIDSPVFADSQTFMDWKPETSDSDSRLVKAITIYQDLLRFHASDDDPDARLDVDLQRLEFGNNEAAGETKPKSERFIAALRRFIDQNEDHPIVARALHLWALDLHSQGDLVKAHAIATRGLEQFPGTVGGNRCFNLIQSIEARSASAVTERVWNEPAPTIDIQYRNVNKVYLRLVPFDFKKMVIDSQRWQATAINEQTLQELLATKPTKAWAVDLPATTDYQLREESIPAPLDVPLGSYFLLASENADFSAGDNQISAAEVWRSDLAIVSRSRNGEGIVEGLVLDAISGNPIQGASVQAWNRGNRNETQSLKVVRTDRDGRYRLQGADRLQLQILVTDGKQQLSTDNMVRAYRNNQNSRLQEQTRFFTDRAIYRPGQTIRYKGVCLEFEQEKDLYQTIPHRDVVVVLRDVNGEEVERLKHRTNGNGSFQGSFTAPRGRVTGMMTLMVDGNPSGATSIRVEEYKRPKFRVAIDPPTKPAQLGEDVQVSGKATAYTGASIGGAKVQYRVVREVRYPDWWYWRCWWMPPTNSGPQEIVNGVTTTEADGGFEVPFTARPDESVLRESEPVFQFTIYADVTDLTGETRSSSQTVRVGYTTLAATLNAAAWQTADKPVSVDVQTSTLNGDGRPAKGTLKVYALQQPEEVMRAELSGGRGRIPYRGNAMPASPDPANPNSWDLGKMVADLSVETDAGGKATVEVPLPAGIYRAVYETTDSAGEKVTALLQRNVLDLEAEDLAIRIPDLLAVKELTLEPGDDLVAVWGSGYEQARAFVEIEHRGKILQEYWTNPQQTQFVIEQSVTEAMRGGFTLRVTMVRENRAYLHTEQIQVPWTNKELDIQWERFVSKLAPGAVEKWTAKIQGPDAEVMAAEMVATLYDASLDAFAPHSWMSGFNVFRTDHSSLYSQFENNAESLRPLVSNRRTDQRDGSLSYRHLANSLISQAYGYGFMNRNRMMRRGGAPEMMMDAAPMGMARSSVMQKGAAMSASEPMPAAAPMAADADAAIAGGDEEAAKSEPDLTNVTARKNLAETAFFFPQLIANDDGTVTMEFTMPEALTEWKFIGFAHDNQLRAGILDGTAVTSKDLMVEPNPPRFVREGDRLEFTVKVSNQSPTRQTGKVRLAFQDARSGDSVDASLGNANGDKEFAIAAGESQTFAWQIKVPDNQGVLVYKAVGATGRLSDGEEGFLPVLSRKVLVTESLPLPIRGNQTKKFVFDRLLHSGESDSLQNQSLTVQMVSNPAWYAVMALPYLMEYPHQCSEQTFNRLYANALGQSIANSDPRIEQVFEQWRGTDALDSPLEKNEDLKSVMLEETPWLRDGKNESQARRNVGILFDGNRLSDEINRNEQQLAEMQLENGMWPWFPGGSENEYITLYITTGFGRLRHLGVDIDVAPAVRSLAALDRWMTERYRKIADRDKVHISSTIALYLYGRSFFLEDHPVAEADQVAFEYWQNQARTHWLKLANRQSQGHLALALKRLGDPQTATKIMASIKERSVTDEELGMYWREQEHSWWWYRAPIETQAVMIEAFDEVMDDAEAVEDCKVWLLKQKQTQDWKTTKATADAVYALLLRGSQLLESDALVEVTLGKTTIQPQNVEAGTGFYQQRFTGSDILPEQGEITVRKLDDGVAWGAVHWQYLEDMTKVTAFEGTPLTLQKKLYVKRNTPQGPTLTEVEGPLEVGDELVVRIVLRSDRDMEYLHLKDYRGSGTEPVNVLSSYRYQDGLAYYESTRDTASHFFIDYLPKGTYVFEYSTRIQLRGEYQTGFAEIQSMYAPEFNSHSESLPLVVQ